FLPPPGTFCRRESLFQRLGEDQSPWLLEEERPGVPGDPETTGVTGSMESPQACPEQSPAAGRENRLRLSPWLPPSTKKRTLEQRTPLISTQFVLVRIKDIVFLTFKRTNLAIG
ncbi:hypothetical protein HispidOSU_005358, partial [Sigmodon hispidus]